MLTVKSPKRLGYLRDIPDQRDFLFSARAASVELRTAVEPVRHMVKNFHKKLPVAYDQLDIGSCVANSSSAMFCFIRNVVTRSRLQIYYEARRLIGLENADSGCYNRDAMKVLSQLGAGRESWWPYDTTKFTVDPPLKVDRDALKRRIMTYYRLRTRQDFRRCLLENHPFIIGFSVYEEFLSPRVDRFGIVPRPGTYERNYGGHSVIVIGFDDDFRNSDWAREAVSRGHPLHLIPEKVYICRNSWGPNWGNRGDFAIDSNYLEDYYLASDAWTQRKYEVGTNVQLGNGSNEAGQYGTDWLTDSDSSRSGMELVQGVHP